MKTKLKTTILRSIQNKKIHVFGLFLVFSFFILVMSKLSKAYTETLIFTVQKKNVPNENVITQEHTELQVVVKTFGFNLLASYFKDKNLEIDFTQENMYQSKEDYIYSTNNLRSDISARLGSNFEILNVSPDTLYFPYSILAKKKVPVVLTGTMSFAPGYDTLQGFSMEPDSVEVIGPEKDLQDISKVMTAELSFKDIQEDINAAIPLVIDYQGDKIKLSETEVKVSANVEKFTEGTVEVPVQITNLPSDLQINYFPKNIKLSYDVSLNEYKSIKPSDFKVECQFQEELVGVQSFLVPKLVRSPQMVKRVKLKQTKIEYIITQ